LPQLVQQAVAAGTIRRGPSPVNISTWRSSRWSHRTLLAAQLCCSGSRVGAGMTHRAPLVCASQSRRAAGHAALEAAGSPPKSDATLDGVARAAHSPTLRRNTWLWWVSPAFRGLRRDDRGGVDRAALDGAALAGRRARFAQPVRSPAWRSTVVNAADAVAVAMFAGLGAYALFAARLRRRLLRLTAGVAGGEIRTQMTTASAVWEANSLADLHLVLAWTAFRRFAGDDHPADPAGLALLGIVPRREFAFAFAPARHARLLVRCSPVRSLIARFPRHVAGGSLRPGAGAGQRGPDRSWVNRRRCVSASSPLRRALSGAPS